MTAGSDEQQQAMAKVIEKIAAIMQLLKDHASIREAAADGVQSIIRRANESRRKAVKENREPQANSSRKEFNDRCAFYERKPLSVARIREIVELLGADEAAFEKLPKPVKLKDLYRTLDESDEMRAKFFFTVELYLKSQDSRNVSESV